ncbi:MAG: dephospho-CoA kinase [Thermodesulfovibrionales bacterium]|jgi:dephospho-CoA kinase
MLLVALTGNYGMGKSALLNMFGKLGAHTIDSDEVVGSLLKEQKVLDKIRDILGAEVFDPEGGLDRKKVADAIFKDSALRASLENLLHPLVFDGIDAVIAQREGEDAIMVVEIPLLFERGYEKKFNRTITVFTDEATALARLEKKGIGRPEALQRLRAQIPILDKIGKSDFVIDNNGSPEDAMSGVKRIYERLLKEV